MGLNDEIQKLYDEYLLRTHFCMYLYRDSIRYGLNMLGHDFEYYLEDMEKFVKWDETNEKPRSYDAGAIHVFRQGRSDGLELGYDLLRKS